ncbi:chitinase [Capsaspora owczarzaki ATCC 30864]|uniref:chitinase n=1 Tax=Capsaspora owczarzaki (strain ATCC 30864) TaxID=595528 RepID=UPI000352098A|nr:chitinase [Capsaspora owczarzaki ATCC 30864]|eukprot:XP_004342896.2 chitinase [Capsaspora owczarzaki ATCC 30864]
MKQSLIGRTTATLLAVAVLAIATADAHSWMTCPNSLNVQPGRGGFTTGPCEPTTPGQTVPVTNIKAGERLKVGWTSNNHGGGYVRLALVPDAQSLDTAAYASNVLKMACYGHDQRPGRYQYGDCIHPCNGRGACAYQSEIDDVERYDTTITIPTNLADGVYSLQWVGLVGNAGTPYYSCAKLKVTGGNPAMSCPAPATIPAYTCLKSESGAPSSAIMTGTSAGSFCYHSSSQGAIDDNILQVPINANCEPRLTCALSVNAATCQAEFAGVADETNPQRTDCGVITPPPAPTCSDGIQNQGEQDVDCGGTHCDACPPPPPLEGNDPTTVENVVYSVSGAFSGGWSGSITFTVAREIIGGWNVTIMFDQALTSIEPWSAVYRSKNSIGNILTFSNADWNGNVAKGNSITFGFTGYFTGISQPMPMTYALVCLGCPAVSAAPGASSATPVVKASSATPVVKASSATPVKASSATPVKASSATPLKASSATPVKASSATPVKASTTPTGPVSTSTNGGGVIVGYYPAWATYDRNFQVADIRGDLLTHINYAFANIAGGKCVLGDPYADTQKTFAGDAWDEPLVGNFKQLKKLKAKYPHVKTLISLGGWTWSAQFSDVAATAASRETFATSCVQFMETYGFDGIDVDWEYPVLGGLDGNIHRPEDAYNYVKLLALFRTKMNALGGRLLTIAAPAGPSMLAALDIPGIAQSVDWINLMGYDFNGGWDVSHVAHNAPLYANPADPSSSRNSMNVDAAVTAYLATGMPSNKLVLGVPFYGHSFAGVGSTNNGLFQSGSNTGPGTWEAGSVDYSDIESHYIGKSGYVRYWDSASEVPYLYSPSTKVWVSYDDAESLTSKCVYINTKKLGGAMAWDLSSDRNVVLLSAVRSQLSAGTTTSATRAAPAGTSTKAVAASSSKAATTSQVKSTSTKTTSTSTSTKTTSTSTSTTTTTTTTPGACDSRCGTGVYHATGKCLSNGRCACIYGWTGPNAIYVNSANNVQADYCSWGCYYSAAMANSQCAVDASKIVNVPTSDQADDLTKYSTFSTEMNDKESRGGLTKPDQSSASSSTGAVAGGIVGALCVIAIIAVVATVIVRRRRADRNRSMHKGQSLESVLATSSSHQLSNFTGSTDSITDA